MPEIKNIVLFVAQINKPGGTERVVANLANSFSSHGYHARIISVNTANGASYYPLQTGVSVTHLGVKLPKNVLIRSVFGFSNTISAIVKELKKDASPSILMATDPITCYALAFVKNKLPSNKYIACEHMGIEIAKWHSMAARKILYKKMDAVVVLTNRDKQALIDRKVQMPNCFVIPNELSFFPEKYSDTSAHILLAVGKYDHQKRFDLLIDMVSEPLLRHPGWQLQLIGQGEWEKKLEEKIAFYHLENQILLLPPTTDIVSYYQKAAIYLMSSAYEGFPMVLIEAKACGLPIISFDCPAGPSDIIQKNDGILIPFNDTAAFTHAIEKLMTEPDLRKSMGTHARANVQQYNSASIFEKWHSLFNKIV